MHGPACGMTHGCSIGICKCMAQSMLDSVYMGPPKMWAPSQLIVSLQSGLGLGLDDVIMT